MKLYREVKAKNPDKDGDYRTNLGRRFYRSDLKRWVTVKGSDYIHTNVEYWFEPIEITEEEIDKIIESYLWTDPEWTPTDIAKAILSKLKGDE